MKETEKRSCGWRGCQGECEGGTHSRCAGGRGGESEVLMGCDYSELRLGGRKTLSLSGDQGKA